MEKYDYIKKVSVFKSWKPYLNHLTLVTSLSILIFQWNRKILTSFYIFMHIFNLQFTQLQVVPKVRKVSYESLSNSNYKENNTPNEVTDFWKHFFKNSHFSPGFSSTQFCCWPQSASLTKREGSSFLIMFIHEHGILVTMSILRFCLLYSCSFTILKSFHHPFASSVSNSIYFWWEANYDFCTFKA